MTSNSEREFPRLENYEIRDVLGEGGMGTVFLADDLRHDRQVAIKTIREELVTPDLARRFEREIKLTGGLQHPRILPLLDSGVADGTLFYVMQFVEGESLEERLSREGALPLADALRIARHVADALDSAHRRGIVHRDIKPANVMLSGGHALVMDFGIARALAEGSTSLTGTGVAIGTPKYMSPEQVTDSGSVDGRADIYSLGCVLYEMIAGHPPFTGSTVDSVLRQHLAADPPPLAIHRPGVPHEVENIVCRAMRKSPPDRFSTAREMADTLQEATATGQKAGTPASRRRSAFIVIAAYLAGAWGVLAIVERVAETAELPAWTVPFALVLLLIGLLVVSATAVLQASAGAVAAGTTDPGAGGGGGTTGTEDTRLGHLLRWRNVIAGGVLALLLWGVVAVSALMRGASVEVAAPSGQGLALGREASADPDPPGELALPAEAVDSAAREEPGDSSSTSPGEPRVDDTDEAGAAAPPTEPDRTPARSDATRRDQQVAALNQARRAADGVRNAAEQAGARHASAPALLRADSLWDAAVRAAAAGRLSTATTSFESARLAYGDAAREAPSILATRVDSARRALDSARQRADPDSPQYEEGEHLRVEASEAEARGDLLAAVDGMRDASRAYRLAPPARAEPESVPEVPEPEPEPPAPAERVAAALSSLERAFEAENLAGIQRIWVNLEESQLEGFAEFFDGGSEFDYGHQVVEGSIRPVGESIEFDVVVRWTYTGERGDRIRVDPFQQRFRLEKLGSRDVLRSL